jgi:hypothetical protein
VLTPSTLVLVVDSLGDTCASPRFDEGAVNHELVVVGLAPSLQKPGTYTFGTPAVIAWGSQWLGDDMGNGGGGEMPLSSGSIDVTRIDGTEVVFTLSSLPSMYAPLEGQHTAARCP